LATFAQAMISTNAVVTSSTISVGLAFSVSSSFHGVTTVSKPLAFGYASG
jgi:hypothetical protein